VVDGKFQISGPKLRVLWLTWRDSIGWSMLSSSKFCLLFGAFPKMHSNIITASLRVVSMRSTGSVSLLINSLIILQLLISCSILLYLQVRPRHLDGSSPDCVSYKQNSDTMGANFNKYCSGAQIVFRSFMEPVFAKYFKGSPGVSTSSNLKATAAKVE
jgi:hypothetical protein